MIYRGKKGEGVRGGRGRGRGMQEEEERSNVRGEGIQRERRSMKKVY